MMTADDTPEALLQSFRGQAHWFVRKPFPPARIVDVVNDVLRASAVAALPIEVISASPEWLELVAPCSLEVAERVQDFVMQLDAKLPEEVRESVAQAFRELLSNAVEWGGRLDPTRIVRISCLRSQRSLYRISDRAKGSTSIARTRPSQRRRRSLGHDRVRQMGLRPRAGARDDRACRRAAPTTSATKSSSSNTWTGADLRNVEHGTTWKDET
jgi:hypothetical protein